MKKAYVKPVFVAEEFVAEQNYAAKGCGTYDWDPVNIYPQLHLCYKVNGDSYKEDGHVIEQTGSAGIRGDYSSGVSYWQYAGMTVNSDGTKDYSDCYLFNKDHTTCDFVWNDTTEQVYAWNAVDVNQRTSWVDKALGAFSNFFYGNGADIKNHQPQYMGRLIPS